MKSHTELIRLSLIFRNEIKNNKTSTFLPTTKWVLKVKLFGDEKSKYLPQPEYMIIQYGYQ